MEPQCDVCGEPCSVYIWWCGSCGCCQEHCQGEQDCSPDREHRVLLQAMYAMDKLEVRMVSNGH